MSEAISGSGSEDHDFDPGCCFAYPGYESANHPQHESLFDRYEDYLSPK
jgi:hypothetical protein